MPPTMRLHSGLLAIAVLAALVPKSVESLAAHLHGQGNFPERSYGSGATTTRP